MIEYRKSEHVFPMITRREDETLTDWTLRWLSEETQAKIRLTDAAPDLLEAVRMAIPAFIVSGEDSYSRLLAMCRAYKKATGERHPADRWTEMT